MTACECSSLDVPVDPADPTGATVSLSLARLPATDPDARIGTLITNPGGPGGSGVEFLGNDGIFNDEINRRFDIVSWDPRGVGGTAPLQCGSGFSDTFLSTDLAPRDAAGRAALEESLAANVEACIDGDASLLAHIGTDAAVADLEAIRQALGGDPITYVGFSYGTLIGLRYAEQYPDALRAMVLDGVVRPDANLGDRLVASAASLDRSLAEVLNACGPDCPIDGDPVQAYRDLAEAVRTEPAAAPATPRVGFNAVGMAGIAVTYDEEYRAPFYEAIAQGQHGDGMLFEMFAQEFVEDFELGPNFAVDCIDVPHPTTSAEVEALATQAADAATVLPELSAAYVRVFALPCLTLARAGTDRTRADHRRRSTTDPRRRQHRRPGDTLRVRRARRRQPDGRTSPHLPRHRTHHLPQGQLCRRIHRLVPARPHGPCRFDRLWMTFDRHDVRRDVRSKRQSRTTEDREPTASGHEQDGRR